MFGKKSKSVIIILLVLVLTASIFALVACDYEDKSEKTVSIYIGDDEAIVTTTNVAFMDDLLVELSEAGSITALSYSYSTYGAAIQSLGDLTVVGNSYVATFHTINDIAYRDMSEYAQPDRVKDEKTFFYSGVGISSLPVLNGASYLFILLTW